MMLSTYTGKQVNPADPRPADIDIQDIAHSLSNLCRFNGHCREFYSVAQHSVLVATLVPDTLKLVALLHDAHEAYTGDITSPLKERLPGIASIERNGWKSIASRFGLDAQQIELVHMADLIALATEKRDLMNDDSPWPFLEGVSPVPTTILPQSPGLARRLFMQAYYRCERARHVYSRAMEVEGFLHG